MSQKPTIYDIAELVGLSAGTVSKILNDKPGYSAKTRERVKRVAQEQGYEATFAAKVLRESSTHSIGILTPDVSNEFFSSIIFEAETALREGGYATYICNHRNDLEFEEKCVLDLLRKQVDGLLFVGGRHPVPRAAAEKDVPVVTIDKRQSVGNLLVEVGNDVCQMSYDATHLLLSRGCESLILLNTKPSHASNQDLAQTDRVRGYLMALEDVGVATPEDSLVFGEKTQRSHLVAASLVDGLLAKEAHFDGIVALGDRLAIGAINALRNHGIAIGDEVRVVGTDDSMSSQIVSPSLSTINRNPAVLARDAVLALVAMIGGEAPPAKRIVVPHQIIERETTLGIGVATSNGRA